MPKLRKMCAVIHRRLRKSAIDRASSTISGPPKARIVSSGHKLLKLRPTASATAAMSNQSVRRPNAPIGSRGFAGLPNGFSVGPCGDPVPTCLANFRPVVGLLVGRE